MALEGYGALSKDCNKLVRKLCHLRAEALEIIDEEAVLNYWFRRISYTNH